MTFVCMFPGQGSQKINMMSSYTHVSVVRETFNEAYEHVSIDLWDLIAHGPTEQLNRTEYTQLVMLVADVALWRLWVYLGGALPDYLIGHSLGEYAALVVAGVISFQTALSLVKYRGYITAQACDHLDVSMAAVLGSSVDFIESTCIHVQKKTGMIIELVNYNSPVQSVIAGYTQAVDSVSHILLDAKAKRVVKLPVSTAFHSSLMRHAADHFFAYIQAYDSTLFSRANIPIFHNYDVKMHEPNELPYILSEHIASPVHWTKTLNYLWSQGVRKYIEIGPGRVLTALAKQTLPQAEVISILDFDDFQQKIFR